MSKKYNILITGVAGFLGSHLAEKLANQGHNVIGIDNMKGGYKDNIPSNISFLKLRSDAYAGEVRHNLALKDLDLALSIDKLSGDLYKRRAEIKVVIKDFEGAINDYNSVQVLIPTYKMVHYIKGNLYMQLNEVDFACEEYKLALASKVIVAERVF